MTEQQTGVVFVGVLTQKTEYKST